MRAMLDGQSSMGVAWAPSLEVSIGTSVVVAFVGVAIVSVHLILRRRSRGLPEPLWTFGVVASVVGGLAATLIAPIGIWLGLLR